MIVGIDTGDQMNYTSIVSGSEYDIFQLYSEIEQVMKKEGINPPFRWSSIKSYRRQSIIDALKKSVDTSKINFTVIIHKNKYGVPIRELIYETIPFVIAESLEKWIKGIRGKILFEIDNDFNKRDTKTKHFVNKIFTHIIPLLTNKLIKIRSKGGIYMAEFKHSPGIIILIGTVSSSKVSKSIQIADLLLGCFRYGAKFKYERFFIKKLC